MTLAFIFTTWWSTLGIAAAAASIPVIIHLLNRKRYKVVTWAAMRFLLNAQKQNVKRMRLEQIILLAVRVLILLLVVLAMASVMPWAEAFWNSLGLEGSGSAARSAGRTHKIIVLDGTLSMGLQKKGEKASAFDRARDRAVQIVKEAGRGDSFSVLLMAGREPDQLGNKPSPKKDSVIRAIQERYKTHPHTDANLQATLARVEELADKYGRNFEASEVYFITDLQRATWLPERSRPRAEPADKGKAGPKEAQVEPLAKIRNKALLVFVDVGEDKVNNLAVTNLRVEEPLVTTGKVIPITATVKNYGVRSAHGTHIDLLVSRAGQTRPGQAFAPWRPPLGYRKTFELEPGEETQVSFDYRFKDPGEYAVQVRLQPDDLTPDDSRAVIVTVKKSVPVLVVNGKPATDDPYEGGAEYLRRALNPEPENAGGGPVSRVAPEVITRNQFGDRNERDLEKYDCIFLCDVDQPSPTEILRLRYHLRRGGGVVFFLGPQSAKNLDQYNRLLYEDGKGILPAKLLAVQKAPADHYFAFDISKANFQEPPLKVFDSDDGRLTLRQVHFHQYVRAEVPRKVNARTILSLLPGTVNADKKLDKSLPSGDPLLLLWQPVLPPEGKEPAPDKKKAGPPALYRGWVGLVTTTANMDWTTWPASPSYLPLVQEYLRLAIAGRLREQSAKVGDVLEEYLPSVRQQAVRIFTPDRRTLESRTQLTDEASVFRWDQTPMSGIYRVTIGEDPREHLFAVNVPAATAGQKASESDFRQPRLTQALLKAAYPGWKRLQVVTSLGQVNPNTGLDGQEQPGAEGGEPVKAKVGPDVAWWLMLFVFLLLLTEAVLAWYFGHYSAVGGAAGNQPASGRGVPLVFGGVALALFLIGAGTLIHARVTGDFLGFLPDGAHQFIEQQLDIPPAKEGESNTWQLDTYPLFGGGADDFWIGTVFALASAALVIFLYVREGKTASPGYRALLCGLRLAMVLLTLAVLWPQDQLRFPRRLWPDLVIFVDDSGSMGEADEYQNEDVRNAAYQLQQKLKKDLRARLPERLQEVEERARTVAERLNRAVQDKLPTDEVRDLRAEADALAARRNYYAGLKAALESENWRPSRLQLAVAVLTLRDSDWLQEILARRKMKVYVYHLDRQGQVKPLGDVGGLHETERHKELVEKIKDLRAEAKITPLDTAVRKILGDFSTSSLGAVIMLTDGITVPGADGDTREVVGKGKDADPLVAVARYSGAKGVPLFFVGLGDAHGLRDIRLVSMDAPNVVHVKDYIDFEVTLQGYKETTVPLNLYERDKDGKLKLLDTKPVTIDPKRGQMTVRLRHQPKEVGEKVYVVRLDVPRPRNAKNQPREDYLQLQRKILVEEARTIKVLYVEGGPRYEFRYVKTLLERESAEDKSNKTVDLNVVLLDADRDFSKEDKSALDEIPARDELFKYDVIILGDADPQHPGLKDHLTDLADYVRVRGGGFLMIAGENFSPHAFKDTPLQGILPVEVVQDQQPDQDLTEGYRPVLTLEGMSHPIFRLSAEEADNMSIWNQLEEMYWYSEGYRTKPAAHVLATHPTKQALERGPGGDSGAGKHPLVVYQLVGAGRSMFFGFDETWRWRFRTDEKYFNRFWKNTVDYLSRRRADRIEVRLNKQTPYVRGEVIQVTVRFPDNVQPPPEVKVEWQRTPKGQAGVFPPPDPRETLKLSRVEEAFGIYRGRVSRTREGKYLFKLKTPASPPGQEPTAECQVIPPEGELERLSMNESGMREAARLSGGKFFTLADADQLLKQIPEGGRIEMDRSRPPALLWNHTAVFLVVLFLLCGEWFLRKRKHLL